ncbi:unnamed protein product [Urochloa decumbens]|uniref:Uncharacterized protein n=1 Tax=Urochloa decumbens TaxID=240449 RepID=A0ABC9B0X9_9POAL
MATIIDSLIGSCVQKIQEVITEEAIMLLGVKGELIELQRRMKQIKLFLHDAEQRRLEDSTFNNWLGRLKDAMYDADDTIDLAKFEGSKLVADRTPASSSKQATPCGCSVFSCFSNIRLRHKIGDNIRNLNRQIESIKEDKIFLTLDSAELPRRGSASTVGKSSPLVEGKSSPLVEPNLVGNEVVHASRKIVDLVLAHKEKKAYKVAIVGIGGIGKTTLAQKIYNDKKINGKFSKQAWVCVSRGYRADSLLRQILRNMEVSHDKDESVGELQTKLELSIRATGTILITTRHDTVAFEVGADHVHRVELMSDDVGWELLTKSMNIAEEKQMQNLRDIGVEIVRKCAGLPLAIVVIARVLASKDQSKNEWKKILNKNAWSMDRLPSDIRGALYLSYEVLPQHLKQCFLYCVIYPEDSNIYLDDITRMWIAEGFIDEQEGCLLEGTAEEYYYELIQRNLLQPDYSYFVHTTCRMHDLVRQLACYLSRDECFVGDPESLGGNTMRKLRCISVVTEKDMVVLPSMGKEQVKVRTPATSSWKSLRVETSLFRRLPYIRVLDLTESLVQNIPDYIGNLIHLRLLDLEAITKLDNLRCLCLRDTPINQVPKGIGRLKLLNDTEGFPIGGGSSSSAKTQDGWNLEELSPLLHLRRLVMIKLQRAVPCSTDSFLIDKKYLKILYLRCNLRTDGTTNFEMDVNNIEKVFEQLIPPDTLEDLVIEGFFGQKYPTWLSTTYLSSLKYLNIIHSKSWVHLPPVGLLPDLKYLRIVGAATVKKIGPEFVGHCVGNLASAEAVAFPKLEWLIIDDMPNWEEWSMIEEDIAAKQKGETPFARLQIMPRLEKLDIVRCPKLKALPKELAYATSLKTLQLRKLARLKEAENLPFLSDLLLITGCGRLESVFNIPQVVKLSTRRCPNLRCVGKLDSLQQLSLGVSMQKISSHWVPELRQQCWQLHGEDLDVVIW